MTFCPQSIVFFKYLIISRAVKPSYLWGGYKVLRVFNQLVSSEIRYIV
jgi:hypothetical protein